MDKKLIRLTESDLQKLVKESVRNILKENNNINYEYEKLYDNIQTITNDISNFVGLKMMNNEIIDEKTKALFSSLSDAARQLSNIAHEVEEHLAWDNNAQPNQV